MKNKEKIKSEKRAARKKRRRYPVSGRGVFMIQKLKRR